MSCTRDNQDFAIVSCWDWARGPNKDMSKQGSVKTAPTMGKVKCPFITVLIATGLLFLCTAFPSALSGLLVAEHPFKILLVMIIIVDWAWMTLVFVQPEAMNSNHNRAWTFLTVAMTVVAVCLLAAHLVFRWSGSGTRYLENATGLPTLGYLLRYIESAGPVLALFLPTMFLLVVYTRSFLNRPVSPANGGIPAISGKKDSDGTEFSAADLYRWGKLASLLVMLLALFAFGLKVTEEGKVNLEWKELPAILIVFIVAELGVALVVLTIKVEGSVIAAKTSVDTALDAAGKALTTAQEQLDKTRNELSDVERTTSTSAAGLRDVAAKLSILAETEIWKSAEKTCASLGFSDQRKWWDYLGAFSDSWVPDPTGQTNRGTPALLGELFKVFVGDRGETGNGICRRGDGTVRRTDEAISCITADSIFAKASDSWLRAMTSHAKANNHEMVVWALTTLLPTEFAFPTAYRSGSGGGSDRTDALNSFISSVINICADGSSLLGEYKRVTVFDEIQFGQLCAGTSSDPTTLDNWWIWDSRMPGTSSARAVYGQHLFSTSTALASLEQSCLPRDTMQADELAKVFGIAQLPLDASRRFVAFPYTNDRPDNLHAFDLSPRTGEQFYVLAGNHARWETLVTGDLLRRRQIAPSQVKEWENKKVSKILQDLGWRSVSDWYSTGLHKARGKEEGAWWTVLSNEAEGLLEPLYLDWGGTRVLTLDLLLIGSRPKDGQVEWHGAAISNLSFDRTECTVKLVTKPASLVSLAQCVKNLCNDFGSTATPAQETQKAIKQYGTWRSWPKPWVNDVSVGAKPGNGKTTSVPVNVVLPVPVASSV